MHKRHCLGRALYCIHDLQHGHAFTCIADTLHSCPVPYKCILTTYVIRCILTTRYILMWCILMCILMCLHSRTTHLHASMLHTNALCVHATRGAFTCILTCPHSLARRIRTHASCIRMHYACMQNEISCTLPHTPTATALGPSDACPAHAASALNRRALMLPTCAAAAAAAAAALSRGTARAST